MLLAQIVETEKVFTETAKTFSLAVAILITLVAGLCFVLYILVRTLMAWFKPLVIAFFDGHQKTMTQVQSASNQVMKATVAQTELIQVLLKQQTEVSTTLEASNRIQAEKLDDITNATLETNQLLRANGTQNGASIHELAQAIKKGDKP